MTVLRDVAVPLPVTRVCVSLLCLWFAALTVVQAAGNASTPGVHHWTVKPHTALLTAMR
jgi:hypothetical protein